jgi:pSer/pThr/pTyr-binding forkhead associated (FHA) protein
VKNLYYCYFYPLQQQQQPHSFCYSTITLLNMSSCHQKRPNFLPPFEQKLIVKKFKQTIIDRVMFMTSQQQQEYGTLSFMDNNNNNRTNQNKQVYPIVFNNNNNSSSSSLLNATPQFILIGRNPHCQIVIRNRQVSRIHACIELDNTLDSHFPTCCLFLTHLSENQDTRVNDELIPHQESVELFNGDIISIGDHYKFKFNRTIQPEEDFTTVGNPSKQLKFDDETVTINNHSIIEEGMSEFCSLSDGVGEVNPMSTSDVSLYVMEEDEVAAIEALETALSSPITPGGSVVSNIKSNNTSKNDLSLSDEVCRNILYSPKSRSKSITSILSPSRQLKPSSRRVSFAHNLVTSCTFSPYYNPKSLQPPATDEMTCNESIIQSSTDSTVSLYQMLDTSSIRLSLGSTDSSSVRRRRRSSISKDEISRVEQQVKQQQQQKQQQKQKPLLTSIAEDKTKSSTIEKMAKPESNTVVTEEKSEISEEKNEVLEEQRPVEEKIKPVVEAISRRESKPVQETKSRPITFIKKKRLSKKVICDDDDEDEESSEPVVVPVIPPVVVERVVTSDMEGTKEEPSINQDNVNPNLDEEQQECDPIHKMDVEDEEVIQKPRVQEKAVTDSPAMQKPSIVEETTPEIPVHTTTVQVKEDTPATKEEEESKQSTPVITRRNKKRRRRSVQTPVSTPSETPESKKTCLQETPLLSKEAVILQQTTPPQISENAQEEEEEFMMTTPEEADLDRDLNRDMMMLDSPGVSESVSVVKETGRLPAHLLCYASPNPFSPHRRKSMIAVRDIQDISTKLFDVDNDDEDVIEMEDEEDQIKIKSTITVDPVESVEPCSQPETPDKMVISLTPKSNNRSKLRASIILYGSNNTSDSNTEVLSPISSNAMITSPTRRRRTFSKRRSSLKHVETDVEKENYDIQHLSTTVSLQTAKSPAVTKAEVTKTIIVEEDEEPEIIVISRRNRTNRRRKNQQN